MLVLLLDSVCRMPSRRLNFLAHFLRAWESLHVPLAFYFILFRFIYSRAWQWPKKDKKKEEKINLENKELAAKKGLKANSARLLKVERKKERGYGWGSCQMLCINRFTPVGVSILIQDIPYKALASTWRLWRMGDRNMGVVAWREAGNWYVIYIFITGWYLSA